MQNWNIIQRELIPGLRHEMGTLMPKWAKLVHILEWVRIEKFVSSSWGDCDDPSMTVACWRKSTQWPMGATEQNR